MADANRNPDLVHSYSRESIEWKNSEQERNNLVDKPPESLYTALGNAVRTGLSGETLCKRFCGGASCRHCDPVGKFDEQTGFAIKGLHSHWVTKTILAMSRPVQSKIAEHGIIEQFNEQNIKAIVNLQEPGEHAFCGPLIHGAFSYEPSEFMAAGIAVYNFAWPDFTTVRFEHLLDVVKVVQFAVSEGFVAVHCHAGLGRTGLVIACYLIFSERLSGKEAIAYVRHRRPHSIQTQLQVDSVMDFSERIRPYLVLFPDKEVSWGHRFSYEEHLRRQSALLHGEEARRLRHLSQVFYAVTQRLLQLARSKTGENEREELLTDVLRATPKLDAELRDWRDSLNGARDFRPVLECQDATQLTAFLLCWLQQLKGPAISVQNVSTLMKTPTITAGLEAVDRNSSTLVRYTALFLVQLAGGVSDEIEVDVILMFLSALTHHDVPAVAPTRHSEFARYFMKLVDYVEGLLRHEEGAAAVNTELIWRDRAHRIHKKLSDKS